jgi:L-lactate dehydrogenase
VARKGATNHAIGLVTAALLRWMLRGERRVLTVSRVHDASLGLGDVALSLPAVVGPEGAAQVVLPAMSPAEERALAASARVIANALAEIRNQ